MNAQRLNDILAAIRNVRIAVCGDFCLDAYWMLDPRGSEVSVETGLRAKAVAQHYYSPGGASNIVANLAALEPAGIEVVGVIGPDLFGRELVRQFEARNVDAGHLVVQEDFQTVTYCKQYSEGSEAPRFDFGCVNRRTEATDAAVLQGLKAVLGSADAVIFNQQFPGSLGNEGFTREVNRLFAQYGQKIVLCDSRHYADHFAGVCHKTNEVEAARLCGVEAAPGDVVPATDVRRFAKMLHARNGKPVFITRGARGIVVCDGDGVDEIPGIQILKKLDPVGAGDTIVGALACCLAATIPPAEAGEFANFAAAVTVQKLFCTGTASGTEILALAEEPDYIYQPELAEDIRQANRIEGTEIELCGGSEPIEQARISHAVFDHDGTISALRQGWEAVMEPVMIRSIMGDAYESADETTYHRVCNRVRDTIDKTTGMQTLVQMEMLVDLVREFDLVPAACVQDAPGYKAIYNRALMEMVDARIDKLQRGELDVSDCTIKGAVEFLEVLHERGVTLYLASGTDRDDVKREAEALGYAHLFEGGIHGAIGDINKYSKKLVIKKILDDHNLQGTDLACFGDGPVEIRECRRHGGIAVGIASDEIRRYGLNPPKRTRLVKAGARIIVPDLSQRDALLRLLKL